MKKLTFLLSGLFLASVIFAQDGESTTDKSGYAFAKIVGLVVIAGFVIWGIRRVTRKK